MKGTHRGRPSKQIWPGQKLTSILGSPNRFDTRKLLFEARDSSPPTQKLAMRCFSMSSPRSVFHPFSQNETIYGKSGKSLAFGLGGCRLTRGGRIWRFDCIKYHRFVHTHRCSIVLTFHIYHSKSFFIATKVARHA